MSQLTSSLHAGGGGEPRVSAAGACQQAPSHGTGSGRLRRTLPGTQQLGDQTIDVGHDGLPACARGEGGEPSKIMSPHRWRIPPHAGRQEARDARLGGASTGFSLQPPLRLPRAARGPKRKRAAHVNEAGTDQAHSCTASLFLGPNFSSQRDSWTLVQQHRRRRRRSTCYLGLLSRPV
eukprot:6030134-Prymnesium_polylepis.2